MSWQSDLIKMFTDAWGLSKESGQEAVDRIEELNDVTDGAVEEILVDCGVDAGAAEIAAPVIVAGIEAA